MHEPFHITTMTVQFSDDVVVMFHFSQNDLGLWGYTRVQTRAGVHIGTIKSIDFYASLRGSVDNALESIFVDDDEERSEAHEDSAPYNFPDVRSDEPPTTTRNAYRFGF